jgi:hypothetical protein
MAYTTINKSTDYFNTVTYNGNGSTQSITGVGFQPDFVWGKARSGTDAVYNHQLFDVIRGATKHLRSNNTTAEGTLTNSVTSFDSDGFSLGNDGHMNLSGNANVAWNWLAGGTASSNTDGSITSTVSANTTSGFSIVSYSGNGTSGATVGHGLGSTPKMIIARKRNTAENWIVYNEAIGNSNILLLNTTAASTADNIWTSSPTSSVFSIHSADGINGSGGTYIAYCFAEVPGYSKFGSYTGTGGSGFGDFNFIYTGFKPRYFMLKDTTSTGDWNIWDSARSTYNSDFKQLYANSNSAEGSTTGYWDFLSNGIKQRHSGFNTSGNKYIYMAFGQSLVGSNNVPCTAR